MAKVALLFPGQGAQSVGMGKGLIERSPKARELFERAGEILGYDLLKVCLEGPEELLNSTNRSQPALFVHSMAALEELKETKPEWIQSVVAVAGLSLGEYSALASAGAITFEDGLRLVQERGSAMQEAAEAVRSGMASVIGLELEKVEALCAMSRAEGEVLQVANLLCPGNIAISGHEAALAKAEANAEQAGAMKFIRLSVAGAFHTSIMQPAMDRLSRAIGSVALSPLRTPLFSNVDGKPHSDSEDFRSLLPKQLVSPVQWEATLRNLMAEGVDQFVEVGAGRVLAGTLKRIDRKMPCECHGD